MSPRVVPAAPASELRSLPTDQLEPSRFSLRVYGEPDVAADGLLSSVRAQGVLVPLVVTPTTGGWEVLSGHRRLACARELGLPELPCQVRPLPRGSARRLAVLEYNRQRRKTFSQMMREADVLEAEHTRAARQRQWSALRQNREATVRRDSDAPPGRTDTAVAQLIGLGGKDLYRQARAVWRAAVKGDIRAQVAVHALDAETKTVHAAYKDLRRRDRFTSGFKPTPYDVWSFRHDRAYGIPHPGDIPPSIVAHTLHYFTQPGDLVVDPMAGGGTTLDVCLAMGRRCLAYDVDPARPDILPHDVRLGLPEATRDCDLIFCDPPYHTMLARSYGEGREGVAETPLPGWIAFLQDLSRIAFLQLCPGGHVALLLANQTEKDLPAGYGYLDHAFLGYEALRAAGFLPVRRISGPMAGGYQPQQVRKARTDARLLGLVRDLLVMRKPFDR